MNQPPPPYAQPCVYFIAGRCKKGNSCPFLHTATSPNQLETQTQTLPVIPAAASPSKPCLSFANAGLCQYGARCKFLHISPTAASTPGVQLQSRENAAKKDELHKAGSKTKICTFWAKNGTCTKGNQCGFRHSKPKAQAPKNEKKQADVNDIIKFINTKSTTNHYSRFLCVPAVSGLYYFHQLTRFNGITTASAAVVVTCKQLIHNGLCSKEKSGECKEMHGGPVPNYRRMTFTKPELFFSRVGYVPYDPDEMFPVKDGIPQPPALYAVFNCEGTPCSPVAIPLPNAPNASRYKFHGNVLIYFFEYPDSTGVHFEKILVFRFDIQRGEFVMDGEFKLRNNYINCATATDKYLLISYWPYDVEAVKRVVEHLAKEKAAQAIIRNQEAEIARLQGRVIQLSERVDVLTKAEELRKKEMEEYRKREAALRQEREAALEKSRQMEAAYQASLRARDPIHLYARVDGKWQLLLDYHEGAFGLQVCGDTVFIEFPENHQHEFEIVCNTPLKVKKLGAANLPVIPQNQLCTFF